MDVTKLIQLAWPAHEGQTVAEATGRSHIMALRGFIKRWEGKQHVPYGELVKFGRRLGGPGLTLSPAAQQGICKFMAKRADPATKLRVAARAEFGLGRVSFRGWQACIQFAEDGSVSYIEGREYICGDLKGLRHEFLKE